MLNIFKYIYNCTVKGFEFLSFMLLKGVYFYLYVIVVVIKNIFKNSKTVDNMMEFIQQKPRSAESSLLLVFAFVVSFSICELLFLNTNEVVKLDVDKPITVEELKVNNDNYQENYDIVVPEVEESKNFDKSLFKYYGNMQLNQVNIKELRTANSKIVGWLVVDGTNINYPILQTGDNDYYLNNNINDVNDSSGWPFMDYRNNSGMSDDNTIFYGHNLLNNTSFGSISKIFTTNWFNNSSHKIIYLTDNALYTYEIFSVYYINPENYYLQINLSENSYSKFIEKLKFRSTIDFGVNVDINDKIITLSTCTNDNTGRKVVHAKLISKESF